MIFGLALHYQVVVKDSEMDIRHFIFFTTAIISLISFTRLAMKWPKLIKKWCQLDEKLNSIYGYPKYLKLKLQIFVAGWILLIFGEYIALILSKFVLNDTSGAITLQQIMKKRYFYIFSYVPYNTFVLSALGVSLPLVSNYVALFIIDLFIILISITISFRFKQINEVLQQHKNKNSSINFWMTVRKNYSEMGNLFMDINDSISNIVVLSYGSNMIVLINNLGRFISNDVDEHKTIFEIYSFVFLIIRLFLVYFFSARINSESRKPIRILFAVSTEIYNVEIRRWYMQMKLDSIALTGNTLFKITPGLILSICGAIVTYELIFIQFSNPR
ncbi:gustatory receptor for sugar taste 64e-like [Zophobas morio]